MLPKRRKIEPSETSGAFAIAIGLVPAYPVREKGSQAVVWIRSRILDGIDGLSLSRRVRWTMIDRV